MSIIQISELLLKNIDEEFPLDSFSRRYCAYMKIWTPKVGDNNLYLKCEDGNEHNKYVAAVMIGGRTGGHLPKNLSKISNLFKLNSS